MIHSVSKDMITVIQCMPRLAERTTQATLVQLKARTCLLLSGPVAAPAQLGYTSTHPLARCASQDDPAPTSGPAFMIATLMMFTFRGLHAAGGQPGAA